MSDIVISDYIQFFALLIALATLIFQQRAANTQARKADRRIGLKLEVFDLLSRQRIEQDNGYVKYPGLTQQQLITSITNSIAGIDEKETQKIIYEMLVEQTLRYTTDDKYRPRVRDDRQGTAA